MESAANSSGKFPRINRDLVAPLLTTGRPYFLLVGLLACIVAVGAGAWIYQIETGIGQTNLHPPIFWGIYIASFVYWIGVSHSGTFISGALRIAGAEWRRPITRIAELMTLITIIVASIFIFVHLGRSWRWYYLLPYPNQRTIWPDFRSPLLWDATAIFTYAISSTIYLYLPLIPDFALMRDRIGGWRQPLYRFLAIGWQGSQRQWRALKMAIRIITPLIFMIAVSVHSIVGFDFAMALVPMWHSSVFAPYFVAGAVHSGLAMVVVGMYFLRRAYRLEDYVRPAHFDKVGKLMVAVTLTWGYLYFCDKMTAWYGMIPAEMVPLMSQMTGPYALPQWIMVSCNFIIPMLTLTQPAFRRWPIGMMVVGILINIGMYIERVLIIVPPLAQPRLSYNWSSYFSSGVDFTIELCLLALGVLLYALLAKFVPVISIGEEKEGRHYDRQPEHR